MKNAHERFGKLVYVRRTEKASTNIRLHLGAFIGEERGKAHFVSVIGGDVEIGAVAAAFANGDLFTVIGRATSFALSKEVPRRGCPASLRDRAVIL